MGRTKKRMGMAPNTGISHSVNDERTISACIAVLSENRFIFESFFIFSIQIMYTCNSRNIVVVYK